MEEIIADDDKQENGECAPLVRILCSFRHFVSSRPPEHFKLMYLMVSLITRPKVFETNVSANVTVCLAKYMKNPFSI